MSAATPTSSSPPTALTRFAIRALPRTSTHVFLGIAILLLDLVTGPYLLKRFNVSTSHGISPEEAEKMFGALSKDRSDAHSAKPAVPMATTRT
jgi:hypothetical protein